MIMKTIGTKTEQTYKEFYHCKCPRKRKGVFKECLMTDWQPLIDELSDYPIQINQFIKGRKGDRKFSQKITDERIANMGNKVKQLLIETKVGVAFYKDGREKAIKNLTFCVLGCQMLKKEHSKPKPKKLSKIKALLINMLLIYYYLVGDKNISNATIQEFEERIIKRMSRNNKSLQTQTSRSVEVETKLDNLSFDSDYMGNWEELSQKNKNVELEFEDDNEDFTFEDMENAVIEVSEIESDDFLSLPEQELEEINFSTVENYFLRGDRELTDTLIDYCPKIDDEKHDVTCDTCDDTYYLASNKIVHLFIYQNELFKDIDLSADCLLEQEVDVKELRRLVELHIRKYTKWELSKKKKNKFVLCTLCHKIREYKRLGQLDLLTAVKAFFIFMGKIYQLPEEELKQKMEEVIQKLRLDEPKVIGKVEHIESKPLSELLKDILNDGLTDSSNSRLDDKEDVYAFLKSVWEANPHLETKTKEEIAEQRRRAKRIVKERSQLFKKIWEDNHEFRPYLAVELLNELKKQPEKDTQKEDTTVISNKQLELYKQQCNECRKTIDFDICLKRAEEVVKAVTEGDKETQELWKTREDLRPCIANRLSG